MIQIRSDGCNSYFVFDAATRQAVLIDPVIAELDTYREKVSELGLKVTTLLETHTHADHFSASHVLRQEWGCEIGIGALTESMRATVKLRDQQILQVGRINLKVLFTPGHTPDSVSYYSVETRRVFTGDTLFNDSTGRTDFPNASPLQMFESLKRIFTELPPTTLVFPGHEYNDVLFSTLEFEKNNNPQLRISSAEAFKKVKDQELIDQPVELIRGRIEANLQAHPRLDVGQMSAVPATACGVASKNQGNAGYGAIQVDKYAAKIKKPVNGHLFIDVREPAEFQVKHIPGTTNMPLSDLGDRFQELSQASRVYISCLSGRRSSVAAKTLTRLGLHDVVNVTGGFKAWQLAGYPCE